jgi:hypothetical protein
MGGSFRVGLSAGKVRESADVFVEVQDEQRCGDRLRSRLKRILYDIFNENMTVDLSQAFTATTKSQNRTSTVLSIHVIQQENTLESYRREGTVGSVIRTNLSPVMVSK